MDREAGSGTIVGVGSGTQIPYDGVNMADSGESRGIEQRLVALEEWMMHTDHLLKSLNDVVCTIQDRLDEQARLFTQFKAEVAKRTDVEDDDQERSLEDECPPHY